MLIRAITIGKDVVNCKWDVTTESFEIKNKFRDDETLTKSSMFLSVTGDDILQKIKIYDKNVAHPEEGIDVSDIKVNQVIKPGKDEKFVASYGYQTINIPSFDFVKVKANNLNPYLISRATAMKDIGDDLSNYSEELLIVILSNEFRYVRGLVTKPYSEMICTFHSKNSIGCVIKIEKNLRKSMMDNGDDGTVFTIDTNRDDSFIHMRVNSQKNDNDDWTVGFSKVRNEEMIEKLTKTDKNLAARKTLRRFSRFSTNLITPFVIVPSDMDPEQLNTLITDYYDFSYAMGPSITCVYNPVDVDKDRKIIENEKWDSTLEAIHSQNIKAFTLINCKVSGSQLNNTGVLYCFMTDPDDDFSDVSKKKPIKCIRTN